MHAYMHGATEYAGINPPPITIPLPLPLLPLLVTVSLSPIGSAPVLKQKKFAVSRERSMGWMHQWLRKTLKCDPAESVVRSRDIT